MTDQQQFELALRHLVRIAAAIEQLNATLKMTTAAFVTAVQDLDSTLNEVVVQGKSGKAYLSAVVKRSAE